MNRRRFLSSLGIGVAALYLRVAPKIELPPSPGADRLLIAWYQTTRLQSYTSEKYIAVLNAVLAGKENEFFAQFKRHHAHP